MESQSASRRPPGWQALREAGGQFLSLSRNTDPVSLFIMSQKVGFLCQITWYGKKGVIKLPVAGQTNL